MDSLTHIAVGAVIGDACAGKTLGKRAMWLGAVCQSIPDIDFIGSFFLSPTDNLLAHRGFTHSLIFGLLITVILSYIATRWQKSGGIGLRKWLLFIGVEIAVHLILDACNAYGVGWFEPFTHHRISFHIIFIADPLFSLWPGIAALVLWRLSPQHSCRTWWIKFGLAPSFLYLCFSLMTKTFIDNKFEETLDAERIPYTRYFTSPTPLNNLLWYCVAESDSGYQIGYRSVFDSSEIIDLKFFPRQRWLLNDLENEDELGNLLRFSNGYYTVEKDTDALIFNDLRFGRVAGWEKSETDFVFHFYLQQPGKNRLVVQRGRFAEWNIRNAKSLANRIGGK